MRQYYKIKAKHPNAILLFRMGDFYETFDEDARTISRILGITLTKRANGQAHDVPLAGFPHHALDNYLPKLVRSGQRVAICEQLEDPKAAKTIVKRDVVEVVTPGVSLHDELLNPRRSNFVAAVHFDTDARFGEIAGFAFADISTGEFSTTEFPANRLSEIIQTIAPAEILLEKKHRSRVEGLRDRSFLTTTREDWVFGFDYAYETLLRHFRTHSLKGFGVDELKTGIVAAGAVLQYLDETQRGRLPHITKITPHTTDAFMALDPQTKRNLELVSSMHDGGQDGTLVGILDHTQTPMGARLLRKWLLRPLRDLQPINRRLEAVASLVRSARQRERIREALQQTGDLERLAAKVCIGRATPRDLLVIRLTLERIPDIKRLLVDDPCEPIRELGTELQLCHDALSIIREAIVDEAPVALGDGGVIRQGFNKDLDELRSLARSGKDWVAKMQKEESERTGIPSLKVGFNKVFGYYLEITNAHKAKVPAEYIRKQTLVNAERYITPELKEYEEKILSAEEKIAGLEAQVFEEVRLAVAEHATVLQQNAALLAALDCLASLAESADKYNYVRPELTEGRDLDIKSGRHPVVERLLPAGEPFIPNDIRLDADADQILIITGPNMAGKSVILRQAGLIALMAQVGSFVPAEKATIGIVDRIFTRVGASDNLAAGESTFLVEMNETANILNNASDKSLILLDEVGRGTSTFDGLSIAWALVEYLHENPSLGARTLFATHYHELNELQDRFARIRNARVQVQEHDGRVIFLRKLVDGGADHSYGIAVAQMAGLPLPMLARAKEILRHLENQRLTAGTPVHVEGDRAAPSARQQPEVPQLTDAQSQQMSLFMAAPNPALEAVRDALVAIDPDRMTPIDALMRLSELKNLLET
jgi:DNA mismatch repair protein MutS